MYLEKIDSSEAIPFNNAFIEPNTRPINRDRFYDMMDKNVNFHNIVNKLYWKYKLKMKIKSILGPSIVNGIKRFKNGRKN